jgi:hypothetical protein
MCQIPARIDRARQAWLVSDGIAAAIVIRAATMRLWYGQRLSAGAIADIRESRIKNFAAHSLQSQRLVIAPDSH